MIKKIEKLEKEKIIKERRKSYKERNEKELIKKRKGIDKERNEKNRRIKEVYKIFFDNKSNKGIDKVE